MVQTTSTTREAALRYTRAGLAVIPVRADGSKQPNLPAWKEYQQRLPTEAELARWFGKEGEAGIAVLGGRDLEILDFDRPGLFEQFRELSDEVAPGLIDRLPRVATPSGGVHLYYRCETIGGNAKLAKDASGRTLIETRGEGGYVLAPPSPARCHPDRKPYVHAAGPDPADTPYIIPDERQALHEAARSFDQAPDRVVEDPQRPTANAVRPGDDFSNKVTWHQVLEPAGWEAVRQNGPVTYWRKPDSRNPGHHATTGHCGDRFFCFSTNAAPFQAGTAYTRLSSQ